MTNSQSDERQFRLTPPIETDKVQFKHLKMTGFNSFAEPEEISIDDGMTGIVGPNGCGKSNIVEALRWLMGESSARTMRGTDLEDVIFSGTASRPSRNFAEVTLMLDNTEQDAPAHLNGSDEIQISAGWNAARAPLTGSTARWCAPRISSCYSPIWRPGRDPAGSSARARSMR